MTDIAPDEHAAEQADYLMLADVIKHQHDRVRDHTALFMSILSAVLAFIVWFIAEHIRLHVRQKYGFVLGASLLGAGVSIGWLVVLCRIVKDTELRYFQLRYLERAMERQYGVFIQGWQFFADPRTGQTRTPDKKVLRFRVRPERCSKRYLSKWLTEYYLAKPPVKTILQLLAVGYLVVFLAAAVLAILKIGGIL